MADGAAGAAGTEAARTTPTVIYIAGYGRSGSTLLERVLAAHPDIAGLGEVEHLSRAEDLHKAVCGCGELLDTCPVWGPVVGTLRGEFDFRQVREEQEAADAWRPGRLRAATGAGVGMAAGTGAETSAGAGAAGAGEHPAYDRFTRRVFQEAAARLGRPAFLVDSSKTARRNALRPESLVRAGLAVRLVHLVRDGRGCMWSYVSKGSNRRIERGTAGAAAAPPLAGLRSLLSWRLANRAAEAFTARYPERSVRLRYEDFTRDPRGVLEHLGAFLGVYFGAQADALEAGRPFPRVHQAAGNRMRSEEVISLRPDLAWQQELPRRYRLLFRTLNGRLARHYGYR